MNKREKVLYLANAVFVAFAALGLEVYTTANGSLLADKDLGYTASYIIQTLAVSVTLVSVFLSVRCKKWRMPVRAGMVAATALFLEVVYFLNYDSSVCWCMGLLCVAYLLVWMEKGKEER